MSWAPWRWWRLAWTFWGDRTVRVWDAEGRWQRLVPGLFLLVRPGERLPKEFW